MMPDGTDELHRRLGGYKALSQSSSREDDPEPSTSNAVPDVAFLRGLAAAAARRSDPAAQIHPLFGVSMERVGFAKIL
jgi:hypothetical protein